jgi:aminoglycoside 3-N-acetyltransferase
MRETAVHKEDIVAELRRLGVARGDLLQVHSSLRAFGWMDGGADAVVEALLETVGPEGTVMAPTFNHSEAPIYDPKTTPSRNGAVTEAVRRRPEAARSLHPTHPYAAIGARAEELVAGHLEVGTYDPLSPLGKLADWGGWVVLLGVGMGANTAVHIGEVKAGVRCLGYGRERSFVKLNGEVREVRSTLWRAHGHCRVEMRPVEERMRARGLITDGQVGKAEVHIMRARDVVETAAEICREVCPTCPIQPNWSDSRAAEPL